jgi:ABC-type Fe3+ transport system permease subunit
MFPPKQKNLTRRFHAFFAYLTLSIIPPLISFFYPPLYQGWYVKHSRRLENEFNNIDTPEL